MKFTVLGGSGFIGSEVIKKLKSDNNTIYSPKRNDPLIFKDELGTVIYCAGNGDCLNAPFAVQEANVELLAGILTHGRFRRLIYLSSTRIYMNSKFSHENSDVSISNNDGRKLFNLTKMVGEELCLKSNRDCVIIRPSNVYGKAFNSNLFLPSITRDAIAKGLVNMYVTPEYSKDYVSVSDVVDAILFLSQNENKHEIYNVASGHNTTAGEIALLLKGKTNCDIVWHKCSQNEYFPITNIRRLQSEMNFVPKNVLEDMGEMIDDFQNILQVN
ncbi:dTDP-glucose 4,6-dehydratase [Buttiauxella noackiae ATCC 51607]|uniref:dTDP-glucose 4,6-dehydratase n=1 Tax=Buttiauxella noackiae ATCC 51607 TaxID=1354255 RepID=A0A1B7HPC7_9ENTR|nr:NAD(P)-dependent oxidoreductase [Buttiauxella noackiae]OAT17488.1 dTDP-glucose 4,6-dehydratase [Buttiauxella noackiae ATCC 51607]